MTSIQSVLLILLVVAAIAILLWRWYKSHVFKRASRLARQVFPVWAAQGPFDSGEESAAAMRHAYMAVMGPEETEQMAEAIAQHAATYDSDPAAGERARQEAARSTGPETENFVTIAKGLAAMDPLNKEFLADSGHKLELARQHDGNLGIAYKKIWSDEEIEGKKKRDNEAFVSGIGKSLLDDSSDQARALVAFLADVYKTNTGEEADSPSAIGRTWLAYFQIRNEEPESDLAQEFEKLNDAHQAIIPDSATTPESMDNLLDWSSNPRAHEAHLFRRHNNPYFPESRRIVSKEELAEAKRIDNHDYNLCQERFTQLRMDIEAPFSTVTSGDILELRERLDDLILFSMGVGGPAKEIAARADRLRDAVIADLRAEFSDDEETLEKIEKADAFHRDTTRKFYIPVLAQVLRGNSPILKEETIPTILSADPLTISVFMDSLPDDTRALVRLEALKMMQEALNDGYIDPQFEEKLSALEGQWHFASIQRAEIDEGSEAAQRSDYAATLKELRPLAEQGGAEAQLKLGHMYKMGKGVPLDDAEAVKWYRKAAEQGHADAQYTLGVMYAEGQGVPRDDTEAVKWFGKAAEQGMALAQGKIGLMYAKGQGIPQDYVLAHKWITLFAARGDARSDTTAETLDFLASEMTPSEIAEAQRLAREWTAEFEKRSRK